MNKGRFLGFVFSIVLAFAVVLTTMPTVLNGLKLGLDLKGGFEILYEAQTVDGEGTVTREALRETAKSLQKRADAYGVAEPEVTPEGSDRIRARIAGVSDEETVREIMKKPAELTFRSMRGCEADAGFCKVELTGTDFKEGGADIYQDQIGQWTITISLKDAAKFAEVTREIAKLPQPTNALAIYLDDEQLSAPSVRAEINSDQAIIEGNYSREEARQIADVINLGALPLKLTEKYTQSVGATLGQQSLQQTVTAGGVASVLILLFMLVMYRMPGLIASVTLIVYSWGILLLFYWMNATLTLPGIAAFVLGIGMAVDANIITAERIRDELRSGKSLLSSLKSGSKNSFRTILDANVTTIVAAAVLYYVGTGAIQGFALTLILSNVLSMITNVFFSRLLLQLLVRSGMFTRPGFYGVKEADIQSLSKHKNGANAYYKIYDFIKHSRLFFGLSSVLTAVGIVVLLIANLNYGVDFKAGTSLDISLGQSITHDEAEQIFSEAGFEPAVITVGGADDSRVSARFDQVLSSDSGEVSAIMDAFRAQYGDDVSSEENTVDPGIAQELGIKAIIAVALASVGIIILVSLRFEWRFALAAVIALFHDAFMVITVFAVFRLEVNLPFVAAVLTIIGYSINDTIVIFDRIRENLRFAKLKTYEDLKQVVNMSISQTLARSINTGITVLAASLILFIMGGETIKLFSLAMTLGMVFGIYSSIYIAAQLYVLFKKNAIGKVSKKTDTTPVEQP
ncbi:protein translocase subunit SecD [Paenibacillus sp. IB182496]|uniref:Multifunctional fusion protein n=1 Tax=Paenibacillus sabuli TaxID=2772509 RepID=A0A927BTV1_9BACL|nr:protein translocase subunit SecD [Paenibacillus sabuli]MBD2846703.1 protein translocase subunit SecD [Paenibacillus sabuli]